jgi:hypothetical protein
MLWLSALLWSILLSHILNPWLLVFLLYPLATGSILFCSDGPLDHSLLRCMRAFKFAKEVHFEAGGYSPPGIFPSHDFVPHDCKDTTCSHSVRVIPCHRLARSTEST